MIRIISLLLAGVPLAAQAAPAYRLEASVPLGAPDHWDYLTFDPATQHILIAHGSETTVVDANSRKIVARLGPLAGAHGQAVLPDGRIFVDSGKTGSVTIFDSKTFKALKTVPAGRDADGMLYDPASRRMVVANGDPATATLLDPDGAQSAETVPLGGSPESAVTDGHGALFVNLADKGELVRVEAGRVRARWTLGGCDSPHGLAIDARSEILFSTCRNAVLLAVDGKTGAIKHRFAIGLGTDAAAFDPGTSRAFSANGDGTLSVIQERGGTLTKLDDVATAPGARTVTVDPATGRIYLVTADVQAKLPAGHGGMVPHFTFKPGTVKLLILAPVPATRTGR
jgi:DNA-binding beta-propeller fold protein YncE